MITRWLLAVGLVVAYVAIATAEANRQIRLIAYEAELHLWETRCNIAVRAYLAGDTCELEQLPAPPEF